MACCLAAAHAAAALLRPAPTIATRTATATALTSTRRIPAEGEHVGYLRRVNGACGQVDRQTHSCILRYDCTAQMSIIEPAGALRPRGQGQGLEASMVDAPRTQSSGCRSASAAASSFRLMHGTVVR
jgi:hypothetical protein